MKIVATVTREGDRFVATCAESMLVGEGGTREDAIESLRKGLADALRPEAVAPPPESADTVIDITVGNEAAPESPRREGPGEA